MPGDRKITFNPYKIEKTTLYATTVQFNGNRLEFFTEWQKRFVNTSIVMLDMIGPCEWSVQWINLEYNDIEPADPSEMPSGPEFQNNR